MTRDKISTVAELVIAMPASISVLERLGIDFCCRGKQSIQMACGASGITVDELLALIRSEPEPPPQRSWDDASMTDIFRFVVDTHHRYTREAIAVLPPLARKVRDFHGERHPEITDVERMVSELAAELLPHMLKEEQVLFPYITSIEQAIRDGTERPMAFFGTVRHPIRAMMLEHEMVGEKLIELRRTTLDYLVPEDGCTSYRVLYERLQELEGDLHRHIHLENNILFPRARSAEDSAPAPAFEVRPGACRGNCDH